MPPEASTASRLSIRDIFIVAAVYLFSFLIVAGFPHILMAFPLDDSWIHQVVARNFARYGTLGFIPGVWSSGSSSLLWTLVLTVNWKFLPAVNPVIYSDVLNLVFLIAIGLGLLAMARKDGLPKSSCWIWALTPALNGNFVWLGTIGMEHVLFVALSVAGIYLWFQTGLRSSLLSALCLGALCITRPEGLVLPFLAVIAVPLAQRSRKDVAILVSFVALCIASSLAINQLTSHSWLPMTYAGRKWLYFGSVHVPLKARLLFPFMLVYSLSRALTAAHAALLFPQAVSLLLITVGLYRLFRERRLRAGFLCFWSFALLGTYFIMLPALSHAGRYQPLFLALNFPLMFLGLETILHHYAPALNTPRRRILSQSALVLTVCLLCSAFSLSLWRKVTRDSTVAIESTHATMARYLMHQLPPHTSLAAYDIGRIGYLYGANLIDLGGLTDSSFLPYMQQHRILDFLDRNHIPYFVWPSALDGSSTIPDAFAITPQTSQKLIRVVSFCAPKDAATINYEVIGNVTRCQDLYRLKSFIPTPGP
jgi:hypothetical protein